MNVVYFGSREIYGDFETAVGSLKAHNPDAEVWCIVEDFESWAAFFGEGMSWANGVHWLAWDWQKYFTALPTRTKWKQFGPIRAALTKILPELDRVISLDLDTIVLGDLSPLWRMDLYGCHAAMCREEHMTRELGRPYWNNGVCVMDLARIRADGLDDAMIEELNTVYHPYVGQDAMQMFLRVLDIGSQWNCSKFTAPCFDPVILHYADRTDWRELEVVKRYRAAARRA